MTERRKVPLTTRLRAAAAVLSGRAYNVAKPKASNGKLHRGLRRRTAESVALTQGLKLTDVGRHLFENIPAAKRAVRHIAGRVVGKTGITPQFEDDDLDAAWKVWQRRCGLQGHSWRAIQVCAMSEFIVSGNSFAYTSLVGGKLLLDQFSHERLTDINASAASGNIVSGGIEFSPIGVPVAYHVRFEAPGDSVVIAPVRIESDRVFHMWRLERAGQYRGISDFATGATTLFDMDDAIAAELNGLRLQGWGGLHWKPGETESGDLADFGAATLGSDEAPDSTLNGAVDSEISFGPGEQFTFDGDVKLLDSNRPGGQFLPFMTTLAQYWAVSVGIPPHVITGDYSKANYSSLRASENSCRQTFEDTQQILIESQCYPVVERFVEHAFLTGAVPLKGRSVEAIISAIDWQTPGFPYVDPQKEIQADERRINVGIATFDEICAERGKDGREQRKRIKRQLDLDAAIGVQTPGIGWFDGKTAEPPAGDDQQDEDTQDMQDMQDGMDQGDGEDTSDIQEAAGA